MNLSENFQETKAPETNRKVIQLTSGKAFCYPLYYYIPSITKDQAHLVYHRAENDTVQLYVLNLVTGEEKRLTDGVCEDTAWLPWCNDAGKGISDHRSVLNVAKNEVIYFDGVLGNDAYSISLDTFEKRHLFTLSDDRIASGQNCVTDDGQWFVYIHTPREYYKTNREKAKHCYLCAFNLNTGEQRNLVILNSPIHHVLPYDNDHFVFCHAATENAMLITDIKGGYYTHLRTQDEHKGCVCHYVATKKGIAYEVHSEIGVFGGVYDPFTHKKIEYKLPKEFGYTHTGRDPEEKILFYETANDPGSQKFHSMWYLKEIKENGITEWQKLTGDWFTYLGKTNWGGQKGHFHPQLTPDRNWILFTAGDSTTQTNHIYLMDASDLADTKGVSLK